ncbi:DNA-binding response regulator, OmpR family, contains REC and winged-helix (wHTH) domain [Quadrisphaera granulorum]|uniref:DNA-binding response OmpR family regulator n=1 Tax=Quadrisphaera granulorum TaxID=317664 RepID=A0A316A4H4_9ACTN|nr:response regulator transcription factor [Quadrisphaera granulorum]PWJ52791.1 DNA-binding response OmpR family regulator [Quadrisphaera granulorum]SZE97396.1 DNA-binding response regulator, OmpR family, contains REC and winged-helix (wHTH) domain [Quadrisphaera granulorum]
MKTAPAANPGAKRVLLVEDDSAISEPLARALVREGYDVDVQHDGAGAIGAAGRSLDLVVLDLGLPDMDGLDVARRLRADGLAVPILVLTARADEVDLVVGLDAGADDYVAKPFRLAELLARVRALLRRGDAAGVQLTARGVRLDPSSRRAWRTTKPGDVDDAGNPLEPGKEVQLVLAAKEYELLRVLMREAGTVVPRNAIMEEVWGSEWFGSTKTLDMHVSWLRRKLGDDVADPQFITTVRGVGFRFERD